MNHRALPSGGTKSSLVSLRGIARAYRGQVAVHPTDLDIDEGEFLAILGPSGCGKTTLLRMIGGFVSPDSGTIAIDGAQVTELPPELRPTNMVFQGYGLFPHMTVRQNVGYGLRIAKRPASEIAILVDEMLALTRLEALADRPTTALSGGQQQRAAVARALILRPKVLLLDEPLAALDLKLRNSMQEELRRIHKEIGGTFVFVTHDQTEAMALASRIAVMKDGRIVQDSAPKTVYSRPANVFVAAFVGDANIIPSIVVNGRARLGRGDIPTDLPDGPASIVLRPEAIALGNQLPLQLEGVVERVVFIGSVVRATIRLSDGSPLRIDIAPKAEAPEVGTTITVSAALEDALPMPAS